MISYLPTPGPGPRQANTEQLSKAETNALLHLLPPAEETKQNRQGKINRNTTKQRQKTKLIQFLQILPPPQIVKKTIGIGTSFPFENLGNNSNEWKDNLSSINNKSGQEQVRNWNKQPNILKGRVK